MKNKIYLSPPSMVGNEKKYLTKAFDSNWIAPLGPEIDMFERNLADYLNVKNVCMLSSGTAALHLALITLGITKNDIVLCPSFTFSASANVIEYVNAVPVFVDSNIDDWTIDTELISLAIKKYKPKALIAVDIYGQSCDYSVINDICKNNGVYIIEDAAEALGSEYNNNKLGSFGDIGIVSFNGNKIITTSGGGAIFSNNKNYIEKARFLSTQAREPFLHYEHEELGFNYRMSNLLAGLGRAQLENIDNFVSMRRKIYSRYNKHLSKINGFSFLKEIKHGKSNRWLTTMLIDEKLSGINKDDIIRSLHKENIESRPLWKPMHLQPYYSDAIYLKKGKDISSFLFSNGICLPSGSRLTKEEQYKIIDIICSLLD